MLLPLTLLLLTPVAVLTLFDNMRPDKDVPWPIRGRAGLSAFLLATGSAHFISANEMMLMLPPWMPGRLPIIYFTGLCELAAIAGLWSPRLRLLTGYLLLVFLIVVLPANIYAAVNGVPYGGNVNGPLYLLIRVPYQVFLLWWVYWSTEQDWLPFEVFPWGKKIPAL